MSTFDPNLVTTGGASSPTAAPDPYGLGDDMGGVTGLMADEPVDPPAGDEEENEEESAPDGDTEEDEAEDSGPSTLSDESSIALSEGQTVTLGDLKLAHQKLAESADYIQKGELYAGALQTFNGSPEGAQAVIQAMIDAAIEVHGPDFQAPDIDINTLGTEHMTDTERTLYATIRRQQAELARQQSEFTKALDELKPLAEERRMREAGVANAALVNRSIPGADATPESIARMMRETGIDDPVKAFKVATYDARVASLKRDEAAAKSSEKPRMPRAGGQAKTFDPNDRSLGVSDIARLMEAGFVPVGS